MSVAQINSFKRRAASGSWVAGIPPSKIHAWQVMSRLGTSNYNVQRFYPDAAQLAFSELAYRGTDRIWTALEQGLSVVMNLPAGAHRYVKAWLERDGILDLKLAPSKVSNKLFEGD